MNNSEFYSGKVVLVTGGVGSIGGQIVKNLLKYPLKSLIVLDNNETGLFDLQQELNNPVLHIMVGDIRDRERLMTAFTGVDIVFHAAALKHVPLCEYNPYEAVKTNIVGTQNVLDAAVLNNVEKVISISTDKAVNPINTMGATKYLSEKLTVAANSNPKNKGTVFSAVRFGNVLNSRGSIIPIFLSQLKNKAPLTITDKDMTRFVMTIPEAANLVIDACTIAKGREIFILKMPSLKIMDLADAMRDYLAPVYDYKPSEIVIKYIGIRVGEKLYEELMTIQESAFAYENEKMFIVYPSDYDLSKNESALPDGFVKCANKEYSSKNAPQTSYDGIMEYLKKVL